MDTYSIILIAVGVAVLLGTAFMAWWHFRLQVNSKQVPSDTHHTMLDLAQRPPNLHERKVVSLITRPPLLAAETQAADWYQRNYERVKANRAYRDDVAFIPGARPPIWPEDPPLPPGALHPFNMEPPVDENDQMRRQWAETALRTGAWPEGSGVPRD